MHSDKKFWNLVVETLLFDKLKVLQWIRLKA